MGPRTQIVLTMKRLFRNMFVSDKFSEIAIIVLDIVLKLLMELINSENDNAREKFYRVQWFRTVGIFGRNFEIFRNF